MIRRRNPLRPRTAPRPSREPIPHIGRARIRKAKRRAEVVAAVWKRDDGRCQAGLRIETAIRLGLEDEGLTGLLVRANPPRTCAGLLDVHEIAQRSVYPNGELDEDNCILICRRHHIWIDANQAAAALLGLHAWSWDRRPGLHRSGT